MPRASVTCAARFSSAAAAASAAAAVEQRPRRAPGRPAAPRARRRRTPPRRCRRDPGLHRERQLVPAPALGELPGHLASRAAAAGHPQARPCLARLGEREAERRPQVGGLRAEAAEPARPAPRSCCRPRPAPRAQGSSRGAWPGCAWRRPSVPSSSAPNSRIVSSIW